MNAIRVLLADDHALVRAGLRALLEAAGDMQVIGEAENGRQAVREAERLQPQVVVLDLAMPLLNGIEAARQIASKEPASRVLILSSYSDAHHLRQAVAAGVAGYLIKESAASDLLEAIRKTCNGGAFFSPSLLHRLSQAKRAAPQSDCGAAPTPTTLTRREAEVLQLLAEGYANKQTADVLSLSIKTVEKHRQALMDKLNLHRTASLTRYAVASGVVEVMGSHDWRIAGDSANSARVPPPTHHGHGRPTPPAAAGGAASFSPAAKHLPRMAARRKAVLITWNPPSTACGAPVKIHRARQ